MSLAKALSESVFTLVSLGVVPALMALTSPLDYEHALEQANGQDAALSWTLNEPTGLAWTLSLGNTDSLRRSL